MGAPGDSPLVELDGVRKTYTRRGRVIVALEPLTLSVARGEAVALVGPNGVGKSTALKIVTTLVEPSGGTATVCGHDVVRDPGAVRRSIGVSLGSARSFYWRISARHNLSFFARLRGVAARSIPGEIDRLSREIGLAPFLRRPARRLSRGALARLAVARAMIGDPRVIVLDEPFASVDAPGRELIWRALRARLQNGAAVLLATHDVSAASRCDRAVALGADRAAWGLGWGDGV